MVYPHIRSQIHRAGFENCYVVTHVITIKISGKVGYIPNLTIIKKMRDFHIFTKKSVSRIHSTKLPTILHHNIRHYIQQTPTETQLKTHA